MTVTSLEVDIVILVLGEPSKQALSKALKGYKVRAFPD